MSVSVYTVGDIVLLSGEGWENYCSTPLAGKEREILEVDKKGRGLVALMPDSDSRGYYCDYVTPEVNSKYYAEIVKTVGS